MEKHVCIQLVHRHTLGGSLCVCVRAKNIGCKALAITWLELLQVLDVALRCESPEFVLDERCS